MLLSAKAVVNARTHAGQSPLHVASTAPAVQLLLDAKAMPDLCDARGRAPLHFYAEAPCDAAALCKLLLDQSATVNASKKSGVTALLSLCGSSCVSDQACEVLDLLLGYGGNADHEARDGTTPLFAAVSHGNAGLAARLLEHDPALAQSTDRRLRGPCHEALTAETVHVLARAKSDVHAQDFRGLAPLHVALRHARVDVVRALLEVRADFRQADHQGVQALDECRDQVCWAVLVQHGAPKHGARARGDASLPTDSLGTGLSIGGGMSLRSSRWPSSAG